MSVDDLIREARARLSRLEPEQALAATHRGGLIVDIRSEAQRAEQGLVPGAHFVARNVLEWRADPDCEHHDPELFALEGPLVLMCAQGFQSSLAAANLQQMGVANATDMVGGFEAWRAAGLPVVAAQASADRRRHWDEVHERREPASVSWYQREPTMSLAMIAASGRSEGRTIIDVGAGSSRLVDELVAAGAASVTVLDVSAAALERARARLGPAGRQVHFEHTDLLSWTPDRTYELWHDRALFHFFVDPADRERYVGIVRSALGSGGCVVVATFAPDGPPRCSGLPVIRYDAQDLRAEFGPDFLLLEARRELHTTPSGGVQAFTWVALRRDGRRADAAPPAE